MGDSPRRGWRETIEPGLYRAHWLGCASSRDRRPGRRCGCPFQIRAPGGAPGTTRTLSVPGSIGEARAERRRLLAAGRPASAGRGPGAAPLTLHDLTERVFLARGAVWAANTLRNRDDDYRRRIAPRLGALLLAELDRSRVELWLAEMVAGGASRRAIVQTVATLKVILGAGVEWGLIERNPARRLRLPRPDPNERSAAERVLDRDQLARLFGATGSLRTETMLRAAGEAGLRRGEIAGLRWPDVDLVGRRIEVRRGVVQEQRADGHTKVVTGPKAGRARRVAISPGFARRLGKWYTQAVLDGASAEGWVWPGRDGGPMHGRSLGRALERACIRAGLVDDAGRPLVSPHRLRHTAASIMIAQGVPLPVVARQLGHANPRITSMVYAHMLNDEALDLAAAAFADTDGAGDGAGEPASADIGPT